MTLNLAELKKTKDNESIYIIGNGPSLNAGDLEKIRGRPSIAMNRISRIYAETRWRPTHFVCTTTNVEDNAWRDDILESVRLGIPVFVWEELASHFVGFDNVYQLRCLNGNEVRADAPMEWWSDDISQYVTKFGSSMIVAFQIAVYMGYQRIFVLGADLNFSESLFQKLLYKFRLPSLGHRFDRNHFFSSYGTPGFSAEILNRNMLASHRLVKQACDQREVEVFNVTRGGQLEVYPRLLLEDSL